MIKPIKKIKAALPNKYPYKASINGEYYYDHSGYIEVIYRREQIFCREDGRAKDHLHYLQQEIEKLRVLEDAYQFLSNEIKTMPAPVKEDPNENN